MNADGSDQKQVTLEDYQNSSPTWAANNWQIAFASDREENWGIFVINADGDGLYNATGHLPNGSFAAASWSPDGTMITFEGDFDGDTKDNLYVMSLVEENAVLKLVTESEGDDCYPVFSPDGQKILFKSDRSGNNEVYVVNLDGSNLVQLTDTPTYESDPEFSPDGSQIVFGSNRSGSSEIYIMDADGLNVRVLVPAPGLDWRPNWSPDGEWIAFESWRNGNADIYIVRPDGSDLRQLTFDEVDDGHPTWSPDSQKLVFHSNRSGWYELYVMDINNPENVVHIATASNRNVLPAWGPE
jgi:Tol biopolymer transport system component